MFNLFIQLILPFALYSFALADDSAKLPTVNLGYELHQASSFNASASNRTHPLHIDSIACSQ